MLYVHFSVAYDKLQQADLAGKEMEKAKANVKWDEVIGMEAAKREAWELVKLLKCSKEVIRDEMGRYLEENQTLRRLLESVWPVIESQVEDKRRDQIRELVKNSCKMNTLTTNNTEHRSAKMSSGDSTPLAPPWNIVTPLAYL